ncbi:MAG: hypothetical protein AAF697_06655 [Pseudomonadota bacterium]
MSEASFASLGPTLLARKGGAKPAMRPQLAPLPGVVPPEADKLEDLGWNDMGSDDAGATIVSINPSAVEQDNDAADETAQFADHGSQVRGQQQLLADRIVEELKAPLAEKLVKKKASALAKPKPVKKPVKKASKKAASNKASNKNARRAAFTLRLDADRHLKLRLAATMNGVSAQALVTEALDAMLADIDDLEAIAERFHGKHKHN